MILLQVRTAGSFEVSIRTESLIGFFDENEARAYAKELAATEHIDVTVRTASA